MTAVPALRPVAVVAALNSTFQGLVGVVLSALALCVCLCLLGSPPQATANSFYQYLSYYLQGHECGSSSYSLYIGLTDPLALRVWVSLALFFSAATLVSSLFLVVAVVRRWSDEKLQITLVSWLFINSFTAINDVILGYVFGGDFFSSTASSSRPDDTGPLTLAVVAFLAVRGVYLWLVNLAFIVYLFCAARMMHKYLNKQVPSRDQNPVESWPTLEDFGKIKEAGVERSPAAVNPALAESLETQRGGYPEHSARARWPTINSQPAVVRDPRPERGDDGRAKVTATREHSVRRQEGVDNQAFEPENRYFLRLQSETGSTPDYEENHPEMTKDRKEREQHYDQRRPAGRWREISSDSTVGQYRPKGDAWSERTTSIPLEGYLDENGIPIPPVDYLDPRPEEQAPPSSHRPLSLQEAILDRTLRLKKVPDELKKGLQKY